MKDILGREFAVVLDADGHVAFVGPGISTLWFDTDNAKQVALEIASIVGGVDA